MKVYTVHIKSHTDCYKRGGSDFNISGVFISKEKAYAHAIGILNPTGTIFYDCDDEELLKELSKEYQKCKTDEQRYDFVHDNFDKIFGEPEYTMEPSHEICVVTEFELL